MAEITGRAAVSYEITVEGTYYAGTKNNKVHRAYKPEKFILPSLKDAQHTIYRKLIGQRLMVKYDDYVGVRTCSIIDTREVKGQIQSRPLVEIPVAEMSLAQLTQFAIEQGLDVNPQKAGSVLTARKEVSDALDDKHLFERQQREEKAKRNKEKADKDGLDDLNKTATQTDQTDEDQTPPQAVAADPLDFLGSENPTTAKDPLDDL